MTLLTLPLTPLTLQLTPLTPLTQQLTPLIIIHTGSSTDVHIITYRYHSQTYTSISPCITPCGSA